MANLLLDHPWPLEEALQAGSAAFEVLETFHEMMSKNADLAPVPFIPLEQYTNLWRLIDADVGERATATHFVLMTESYVCWEGSGDIVATPQPEPAGVPPNWKQALRSSMGDLRDWRRPQIIIANKRVPDWPTTREVSIRLGDTGGQETRVLSSINDYRAHPFAISDFDAWDLQRCHLPGGTDRVSKHPCCLPKHPELQSVPLDQLQLKLNKLREKGWHHRIGGVDKYYYIPPADWDPLTVSQTNWRQCNAFPTQRAGGNQGNGRVDHWNRVWIWDRVGKRHWDVQLPVRNPEENPEYCVISHTGDPLRD